MVAQAHTHSHTMCWKKMLNILDAFFFLHGLFVYNVHTNLFIASIAAVRMTVE